MGMLVERLRNPPPVKHPKFTFTKGGSVIHGVRYLSPELREQLNAKIAELQAAETDEAFNKILSEIRTTFPVKLVPVKRATLNVYGKTYKGPGLKELQRAARRAGYTPLEDAA